MAVPSLRYRYRVDAADTIVWVDDLWLAFARENCAVGLTKDAVLERSLWDFIVGDELRRLYMEIHARVRSSGRPAVLPFRCDSPTLQRHMRLTISREAEDHLLYESVLIRAVPQRKLDVLDPTQQHSDATLAICSCCKLALLEPVGWLELADVSVRLKLFEEQRVPRLRHTVCPECDAKLKNTPGDGNAA
jgi:hypothetical protein